MGLLFVRGFLEHIGDKTRVNVYKIHIVISWHIICTWQWGRPAVLNSFWLCWNSLAAIHFIRNVAIWWKVGHDRWRGWSVSVEEFPLFSLYLVSMATVRQNWSYISNCYVNTYNQSILNLHVWPNVNILQTFWKGPAGKIQLSCMGLLGFLKNCSW